MSQENKTYCFKITDQGDNEIGEHGEIVRDYSIASRARFLIKLRLGEWWADVDLGSRLNTLRFFKNAQAKIQNYIEDALQPLKDEGAVIGVEIGEFIEDFDKNAILASVIVHVPDEESVELGLLTVGRY